MQNLRYVGKNLFIEKLYVVIKAIKFYIITAYAITINCNK